MNGIASTAAEQKHNKGTGWLPPVIATLITLVVFCLVVMVFGSVRGEEFNSWTFRRRQYRFTQIPFLRWQVAPTKYKDITGPTEAAIAVIIGAPPIPAFTVDGEEDGELDEAGEKAPAAGLSDTQDAQALPSRWDLIETRRAVTEPWYGDAKILCDSLDIQDHKFQSRWENWTTNHPAAANVLWPMVAETARAHLYVLVPDLLDLAANQSDQTNLAEALSSHIVRESHTVAAALLASGKSERALQAFELALVYEPTSKVAALGAASSRAAIQANKKTTGQSAKETARPRTPSASTKAAAKNAPKTTVTRSPAPVAEVDSEFRDSDPSN